MTNSSCSSNSIAKLAHISQSTNGCACLIPSKVGYSPNDCSLKRINANNNKIIILKKKTATLNPATIK